jgi:hypothetical protein
MASGCTSAPEPPEYVVRVYDQVLTRDELLTALQSLPPGLDSTESRRQIVEQWVANALLYQEAKRRGLRSDPQVLRLLRDSEQSVLVTALLGQFYDEAEDQPSRAELQAYFDRHREALRLREPFVRIRYLACASADSATLARQMMQRATIGTADSVWAEVVERFAVDPEGSISLASTFWPESRLFLTEPVVRGALGQLRDGQLARVILADTTAHLLQLVERVPAGALPEISWVEDELRRRVLMQSRKQMHARQVQQLRNEALAREELDMR